MALVKIQNWEGGSNARYDVSKMTPNGDGTYSTDGYRFDSEGRPLSGGVPGDGPGQWTPGLPGARGGSGPGDAAGGSSGSGGSVIPNSGTYLMEQALAQDAYNKAITSLKTQRRQRQITAGMGEDWNVDPKMQYGLYHQMLGGQGMELDFGEANAMERGLQGAGLGRQTERALRYGHAVQNLGFKNQLSDWEQEYQGGLGRAESEKQMAMLQALRDAQAANYGNWGWDGGGGEQPRLSPTQEIRQIQAWGGKDYSQFQLHPGVQTKQKPRGKPAYGGSKVGGNSLAYLVRR